MGTGLFFALLPEALREATRLTGVEYDPITARIAALIQSVMGKEPPAN